MQFVFVLAMVFLGGGLMEFVGMEGILGAFLAGLVLNRLIPHVSPLMNRLEFVGNALFIPYFLIGVGMIIDVRSLFTGRSIESGGSHDSGSYFQQMACCMDHAEDLPYAAQ